MLKDSESDVRHRQKHTKQYSHIFMQSTKAKKKMKGTQKKHYPFCYSINSHFHIYLVQRIRNFWAFFEPYFLCAVNIKSQSSNIPSILMFIAEANRASYRNKIWLFTTNFVLFWPTSKKFLLQFSFESTRNSLSLLLKIMTSERSCITFCLIIFMTNALKHLLKAQQLKSEELLYHNESKCDYNMKR